MNKLEIDANGLNQMGVPTLDINLSRVTIQGAPGSGEYIIRVGNTDYDVIPVPDDIFPIYLDDDEYNAHLVYTEEEIEFYVVKNAANQDSVNDGVESRDVTDLDRKYGETLALYLVGKLRKT